MELLRIKAACPKLADSDPNEMTDDERERFMKERSQRWSQRCSPVIYSSNMRREILPDTFTQFFLPLKYGADVTVEIIGEGAASLSSAAVNLDLLLPECNSRKVSIKQMPFVQNRLCC